MLLIIEKFFLGKFLEKLPKIIQRIYTLFIVMISFIIFEATDIKQAIVNIKGLFGLNGEALINSYTLYNLNGYILLLIVSIIAATPLLKNIIVLIKSNTKLNKIINTIQPIFLLTLLILVTVFLVDNSYNPFLYFRF